MLDLSKFNESQLKAVNWNAGPLLVLSGCGAGKDRALANRIARIYLETAQDVFPILGLVFSNKAATNIKLQVQKLLSLNRFENDVFDIRGLKFRTFDRYAELVIRQHGYNLGRDRNFITLSRDRDRLQLLDQTIELEFPRHSELRSEKILPLINRLTENDVPLDKAEQYLEARSYCNPEIPARIYRRYRGLMLEYSMYDYASLTSDMILLFENFPWVHRGVRKIFLYLCVDEFHNLSHAQYKMLKLMVHPETHNLFLMADYRKILDPWDGENSNRLLALQQDYDMEICRLPENQHCTNEIARAGNKLTKYNFVKCEDASLFEPFEWNEMSSSINFQQFGEFSEESDWIASCISQLDAKTRSKCAILAGNKSLLEQLAESLKKRGVNGQVSFGRGMFESTHMTWFISILKLAVARIDSGYLQQVCKSFDTLCGISINYKDIIPHAVAEGSDYLRSWADMVLCDNKTNARIKSMIEDSLIPCLLDGTNFQKFQEFAFKWLDELEFTASEHILICENFNKERAQWESLVEEISQKHKGQEIPLHTLLKEFNNLSSVPTLPKGAVPCLKISDFVGSGYDHVYIAGLMEGEVPRWESLSKGDDSREIHEDRSNFVAAMTSPEKTLTLSCSNRLNGRQTAPSRFLQEIGILGNENATRYKPEDKEKMVATG